MEAVPARLASPQPTNSKHSPTAPTTCSHRFPRWTLSFPPRKQPRCAFLEGFSLHANTHLHANDRQGLERRCRYGARGALVLERLSRAEDGRIAYRMKRPLPDGTTHLLFTGLELLRRVASLVPGASGKPHEVPRRLRSRRQTAAISGPPSR
ncbi:transposase [Corallococcus sicarius]|uniref:transposase n=1 Tax=Corallococcus sicarius TaxID=2316726 RepID=UPI001FC94422|nr:transposase [Corallococcus sicarius]